MKFETSGALRHVDFTPVVDLLPALRDEWTGLRFDPEGQVLNPLTGKSLGVVALVSGVHGDAGAIYRITVTSPILELPESRRADFEIEDRQLSKQEATQDQWSEFAARRRAASNQVGANRTHYSVTLREDSAHRLAFSVANDDDQWMVEAELSNQRLPKFELNGHIDLTELLKANKTPGCLAGILGGIGSATAMVDVGSLENGGHTLETKWKANRFRGSVDLDVKTSLTRWAVAGVGVLRARGIGRLVLWFTGRRVRAGIDRELAEFWVSSESRMADLELDLARLRTSIEDEGGPAAFISSALWDSGFDPGLESFRAFRDDR